MVVRKRIIKPKIYDRCLFCDSSSEPSCRDNKILMKFLSERGKILGRERTSVCARHQRLLSKAIKRARFLSLLPYLPSV